MRYLISETADMSGLSPSAIRFFESAGLVRPASRDADGHRVYDDRDVARLRFVRRARQLDIPLADLEGLVSLWDGEDCTPVAERLRETALGRLQETRQAIIELSTLATELQEAVARLDTARGHGACGDDCACAGTSRSAEPAALPILSHDPIAAEPIACTLDGGQIIERMTEWQSLLERATSRTRLEDGISIVFPGDPDLAAALAAAAAAEQKCCSFYRFALHITTGGVSLKVTAPQDAQPMLASIFGRPSG